MHEQANPTEETVSNKEEVNEVNKDSNAEQTETKESGHASGKEESRQVDFSQMYDMLTERDNKIKDLTNEIAELKKTNTNLLLKVNASSSPDAQLKTPYESFIDSMVAR